jgi:hypothetical protein
MKWLDGYTNAHKQYLRQNWHKWFAWFPVVIKVIDNRKQYCWLEYVERKGELILDYMACDWTYEYRQKEIINE